MSAKSSTRQQRHQRSRSAQRGPVGAGKRGPGAVVRDAITVDAPAWNAVWAAVVVVPVMAWMLGAWFLPALDIRPRSDLRFFPNMAPVLLPEPLEQQRYVLAVLAAFAVVPCAMWLARRPSLSRVTRYAPPIGLVAVIAVATVSLVRGHGVADRYYSMGPVLAIVVVAVLAFAAMTLFAGRCRWLVLGVDRLSRRRGVEVVVFFLAVLVALGVTSVALYSERNILLSPPDTVGHVQFTFEEATAVAYGRTPLVDFTPQYSALIPWLLAPVYLISSPTVGLFTATMVALSVISLTCLYLTFRLVTGTAARAALLFLPVCAIGFVRVESSPGWYIYSIADYFAAMPLRDAGPLVLGLVCVWVVAAPRSTRRSTLLGAAVGATVLGNVEFGLAAAAGAVLAALVLNQDERSLARRSAVLLAELAAGATMVFVVFALMTVARSGSLPEPGQLVYFQRQFGVAGFFMLPMNHLLDLHAVVFATCAAAAIAGLGIAAFGRVRPGVHGRRSVALLIYSGTFGFGAFAYYMGRTHPDVLSATFLAWGVALMALSWEVGCRLAVGGVTARAVRPAAALLLGASVALSVIAVRHLDYVLHQPARIAADVDEVPLYTEPDATAATRRCVPRGSNVLILTDLPDRVARAAHVHNWFAYANVDSVVTFDQLDRTFDVAARHRTTAAVTQGVPLSIMRGHGFTPVRSFEPTVTVEYFAADVTYVWARAGARGAVDCHGAGNGVPALAP